MNSTISLKDLLNTEIAALRDSSRLIEEKLKEFKSNSVQIDFSDIKFVSRSFAQSLVFLQEKFRSKIDIHFHNTIQTVDDMFEVVRNQQAHGTQKDRERLFPKNASGDIIYCDFFDTK